MSLEYHVAGIRNVAGGSLAGDVPGLEMCGILVANATMLSHCYRDSHVVANICYCHKFMVFV